MMYVKIDKGGNYSMTTTKRFSKVLAFMLALIMMFSLVPIQSFAAIVEVPAANLTLKDGQTVAISNDMNADQIKRALFDALVENPAGADYSDYDWEVYGSSASNPAWDTESRWGSFINGHEWYTKRGLINYYYSFKPVKDSRDGNFRVRIAGATQEVTINKVSSAEITFTYDTTMGKVESNGALVDSKHTVSPSKEYSFTATADEGYKLVSVLVNGKELGTQGSYTVLPVAKTNIEVKFAEDGTFYNVNFVPTQGVTIKLDGRAVSGEVRVAQGRDYKIEYVPENNYSVYKVRFANEDVTSNVAFKNYVGTQTVKFTGNTEVKAEAVNVNNQLVLKTDRVAGYAINSDGTPNWAAIRQNFVDGFIDNENSALVLTPENTEFQEWKQLRLAGGGYGAWAWVMLEGEQKELGTYFEASRPGDHLKFHVRFLGNDQFRPTDFVEFYGDVKDVQTANIVLKQNPAITIKETKINVFDYDNLAQRVFDAAVDADASAPKLTVNDVTMVIPENITTSGVYKVTVKYPGSTSYYKAEKTFDLNVTVEKLPKANIVLNKNSADLILKETAVGVYDNAQLKEAAFSALVNAAECAKNGLDVSKIKMELEDITANGTYTVKFSYEATDVLHANEVTASVNVTVDKCPTVGLTIGTKNSATLYKNYDGSWNYNDLKDQIFALLTVTGVEGLTRDNFNFQYLLRQGGAVFIGQDKYYSFEQTRLGADPTGSGIYLDRAGKFQIKLSIPTSETYYGAEYVFTIDVATADNYTAQIITNEGQPYNLILNKNKDGSWNYDALKKALFEAAVKEVKNVKGDFTYTDFNYQYNLKDAIDTWTGAQTGYVDFAVELVGADPSSSYKYLYKGGTFEFKIILPSVDGSYHGTEVLVAAKVTTNDPFKSEINVKADIPALTLTETSVGVFDVEALKHDIYDKVLDLAGSTPNDIKFEELEIVVPEITKTGDYTVTVKFLGNFKYNESSVSFKLHVDVDMLPTANIVLTKDLVSAQLKETTVNFFDIEALKKSIFEQAVDVNASSPKLKYEDVQITFDREITKSGKYYATIKFVGTDKIHSSSVNLNVDVTVNALPSVEIASQHRRVTLNKKLDNSFNYEEFKKAIFDTCLQVTGVDGLTYDKFDYKYFLRQGGAVFIGQNDWYAFDQGQLSADPTSSGIYLWKGGSDFKVKVSIPDSSAYHGTSVEFTIDVDLADPYYTAIVIKPDYEKNFVLNYNANGEFDYDRLKKDIFTAVIDADKNNDKTTFENMVFKYQILNDLGVDDSMLPGGLSGHYYDFEQGWLSCDLGGTYRYLYKGGTFNVKLIIPASETTRQSEVIVKLNVAIANRAAANVVLKDLTIPYSKDIKEIKNAIFNAIDFEASKLPQNVTADDFKFEYYTVNFYESTGLPGVEHWWVTVEGMKHPTVKGSYFKQLPVGSYAIRVLYNGNEEYKSVTSNEARINVTGRDFDISFTDNDIFLDENLPSSYIQPSVEDNFTKFEIFAYMDGKTDTTIYIDTAAGLNKELAFAGNVAFNHVLLQIFGIETILSADEIYYRRGLSRAELETLVNHPLFVEYMQYYHNVNVQTCEKIAAEVSALPAKIQHVWFKIGQPTKPGTYRAIGIAALENYNSAFAAQDFFIRFHSRGTKLIWWQSTSSLTVFTAKNFNFEAVLTKKGLPINSDHVKYIYTGFRANGKFYASTKNPPREAGIFTQTAYTGISGRYAFPKTRTFIIGL